MPPRLNRDPSYDLARHIITGETGPLSGDPAIQQFDAELDRNDPMDYMLPAPTYDALTVGQTNEQIAAMQAAQSQGLSPQGWGVGFNGMGSGSIETFDIAAMGKGQPAPSSNVGGADTMAGKYGDGSERGRR